MGKFLESEKLRQIVFKQFSKTISKAGTEDGIFRGKPYPLTFNTVASACPGIFQMKRYSPRTEKQLSPISEITGSNGIRVLMADQATIFATPWCAESTFCTLLRASQKHWQSF